MRSEQQSMEQQSMEQWMQDITRFFEENTLQQGTLSQLRRKEPGLAARTTIRPVLLKGGLHYQFEQHYANKVAHENLLPAEAAQRTIELLHTVYRQALLKDLAADVQVMLSKKNKAALLRKPPTAPAVAAGAAAGATGGAVPGKPLPPAHNRRKQYILEDGVPSPFLIALGVMSPSGRVYDKKQDKFKQINRFLEMVSDVAGQLPSKAGRELTVVDFGCGKSYLTFALYDLFANKLQLPIRIIGLDLKEEVIAACSALAQRLAFANLTFIHGDIADYDALAAADMVVTLHACDVATDAALAKAVEWGASVIMSVPCCQHELYGQLDSVQLQPLLQHGLLKERFAALATDAIRGKLLEAVGYKVQMLEFIDPEHTPKNTMIRAHLSPMKPVDKAGKWQEYIAFRQFLGAQPYLERALAGRLPVGEQD